MTCCFEKLSDSFSFGKYKSLSLSDVIERESNYVHWCMQNVDWFCITDECMDELKTLYTNFIVTPQFEEKRLLNIENLYRNNARKRGAYSRNLYVEDASCENYSSSYVQSELGWSDDEIDIVLDGDPDAYWNLD